jgi:hypothetical protein
MIYTRGQVWEVVKAVAPRMELDPFLVLAICEQECEHNIGRKGNRHFDVLQYECSVPRLEQGYMDRYTRDFEYSTCIEGLLAMSYSTMQMMGESLRECFDASGKNYFEWYFGQQNEGMRNLLAEPMSPFCVINALDFYCDHLDVAVEWGCRWFNKKKKLASGSIQLALQKWNGGGNPKYCEEVLTRIPRLTKELQG